MREIIHLKCGCVSNTMMTRLVDGKEVTQPSCTTHTETEIVPAPDLTGRKMKCGYGCGPVPSDPSAAFFNHRPDREFDNYYCGCWGFD